MISIYLATNDWTERMYARWYPNGVKVIPADIEKDLTINAILHMIYDDGSGTTDGGCDLALMGFSDSHLNLLREVFRNKFNIETTFLPASRKVYITVKGMIRLLNLCDENNIKILPAMSHKFYSQISTQFCQKNDFLLDLDSIIVRNIISHSRQDNNYKCQVSNCGFSGKDNSALCHHIAKHYSSHQCEKCRSFFKSSQKLKTHAEIKCHF